VELNLVKADDLELEFLNSEKLEIAQYFLSLPHGFIQLLKNKALNSAQQLAYLVPELKNLDYFLLVQDETEQLDLSNFMEKLSRNPLVQSIVRIDISKLKSKEKVVVLENMVEQIKNGDDFLYVCPESAIIASIA